MARLGVILAGGRGHRLGGGGKAAVALAGRPMIAWPLDALRAVLGEVIVVAKADTALPPALGVRVWSEPAEPRHPLTGLRRALEPGRPVVVCAAGLPLVGPEVIGALAAGPGAVVACADGRL
ncbi:MAG TPA: NTP transferase domain-containing protein [Solirubrobacteraceae bacterium]|nr:NTP transferase domain-containing protein [Solirubrobacteraceae bacterium]